MIETTNVANCNSSSCVLFVARDMSSQQRDGAKNSILIRVKLVYKRFFQNHR